MQEYLLTLVRFLILMASNFGYYNLLRKKTSLPVSFLPMITIGIQVSLLFFSGMLNILLIGAVVTILTGALLLAFDIMGKRWREYRSFGTASYTYLGICVVIIALRLQGSHFSNFDDFSHWATVVQELLVTNSYPDSNSWIINFPTYPLGSSSYIYYACLILGTEEWTQMLIQSFMILCGLMPLFECNRKHWLATLLIMLIFTNFILIYNDQLTTLLVDTLLPVFGMGTFLTACWLMKDSFAYEGNQEGTWVLGPLLLMTVMIKNSGIFFAVPSAAVLIILWRKSRKNRGNIGFSMALPVFSTILWRTHCRLTFQDAMLSKHTVSIANYTEVVKEKSMEDVTQILYDMLRFIFSYPGFWAILLLAAGISVLIWFTNRAKIKNTLKFFMLVLGMYALYIAGLYGMYVFSMPMIEARILIEISRYMGTVDIASFYLILSLVLKLLEGMESSKKTAGAMAGVFAGLLLLWGGLTQCRVISGNPYPLPRMRMDHAAEEYSIPLGAPCVICSTADMADAYMENIAHYLLRSYLIVHEDSFDESHIGMLNNFPYIIMIDYKDEMVNQWIQENYPDQYGNGVIVTK